MTSPAASRQRHLSDFTTNPRVLVIAIISVIVATASVIAAVFLLWLIRIVTNFAYFGLFSIADLQIQHSPLGLWMVLVPVAGSLVVGIMARYGSEKIRGHGIPEAIEAILLGRSRLDAKVAILKPVSSAIAIGTGGPFGAEGPIIMTGGAIGSLIAQMLPVRDISRMLQGDVLPMAALLLLVIKAVIWSVALGSGTSGGVLAPLLIMGGAMGTALAGYLPAESPGFWALLAMAAAMGGTMPSPLTSTFFAVELTGNTHVLLPLITACGTAHLVTVLLMRRSILTEKVARRGHHLVREYQVDPFAL